MPCAQTVHRLFHKILWFSICGVTSYGMDLLLGCQQILTNDQQNAKSDEQNAKSDERIPKKVWTD
jgi:hypothetical protein